MSTSRNTAEVWTCNRCGVCIRQMNGEQIALPDNWASSEDGQFCLICRRALAAEAALNSAPEDTSQDERARLRRTALLEFELSRTPDRSNTEIARACRSSVSAVAKARGRLHLADPA